MSPTATPPGSARQAVGVSPRHPVVPTSCRGSRWLLALADWVERSTASGTRAAHDELAVAVDLMVMLLSFTGDGLHHGMAVNDPPAAPRGYAATMPNSENVNGCIQILPPPSHFEDAQPKRRSPPRRTKSAKPARPVRRSSSLSTTPVAATPGRRTSYRGQGWGVRGQLVVQRFDVGNCIAAGSIARAVDHVHQHRHARQCPRGDESEGDVLRRRWASDGKSPMVKVCRAEAPHPWRASAW